MARSDGVEQQLRVDDVDIAVRIKRANAHAGAEFIVDHVDRVANAHEQIDSTEGAALVVCVVPGGGFDRYFAASAEEFKKGEPKMPLLVKLAAEYGIEFQSGPAS